MYLCKMMVVCLSPSCSSSFISVVRCSFNQKFSGCCFMFSSELLFQTCLLILLLKSLHTCKKKLNFAKLLQGCSPVDGIGIWVSFTLQPKILLGIFSMLSLAFYFYVHCQFCSGSKWICGHFSLWSCQNFANYNAYMSIYSISIIYLFGKRNFSCSAS